MDEKQQFEAWASENHGFNGIDFEWHQSRNCYASFGIHFAYKAWQASRASIVVEPPKAEFFLVWDGKKHSTTFREATENYSAILRAAGITVKGDS